MALEMMTIVNKRFIKQEKDRPSDYDHIRKFGIEQTCFPEENRWLVTDTRRSISEDVIDYDPPLLPCYYGATISEAVTKCFMDRDNHYGKPEKAQIPIPPPIPDPKRLIKKLNLKGMNKDVTKRSLFNG